MNANTLKMHDEAVNDTIEDCETDSDDFNPNESSDMFNNCSCLNAVQISQKEYILHISATQCHNPQCVISLSNYTCNLYNVGETEVAKISTLKTYKDKVIGCKFSSTDRNIVFTGSSDGDIDLLDLRTKCSVKSFKDSTVKDGEKKRTLTCFDVSSNDRLLASGTDLYDGDAYILFWDIRSTNLLGAYWESHNDDVTEVKFHESDMNKLISGSVDGLINIYDLSQPNEEEALVDCLNTDSSVDHLQWFHNHGKDYISCITHTSDLQLWDLDRGEPYKHLSRYEMAKLIKKKKGDHIYVASTHSTNDNVFALVGSNFGDGKCLCGVQILKSAVKPMCRFEENEQIVRSSWYNKNTNLLITGGEKGILNLWKV